MIPRTMKLAGASVLLAGLVVSSSIRYKLWLEWRIKNVFEDENRFDGRGYIETLCRIQLYSSTPAAIYRVASRNV